MERQLLRELSPPSECAPWDTQLRTICTDYQIAQNIAYALNTGFPEFSEEAQAHDRTLSICGSGPSLKRTYRNLQGDIWACNDASWFLIDNGVVPKYVMVWDPQPIVVDCLRRTHPDTTYLVASMCDPSVFDLLRGRGNKVVLWHPWMGDALPMEAWLTGYEAKSRILVGYGLSIPGVPPDQVVGTSAAVTRSAQFAPLLGYRNLHFHGFDSSSEKCVAHFEDLEIDKIQMQQALWVGVSDLPHHLKRQFVSTPQMIRQIKEFIPLTKDLQTMGCKVTVHGDGAIPWLAMLKGWHANSVR